MQPQIGHGDEGPHDEKQGEIEQDRNAVCVGDRHVVGRQKLDLEIEQYEDRQQAQRDKDHQPHKHL